MMTLTTSLRGNLIQLFIDNYAIINNVNLVIRSWPDENHYNYRNRFISRVSSSI